MLLDEPVQHRRADDLDHEPTHERIDVRQLIHDGQLGADLRVARGYPLLQRRIDARDSLADDAAGKKIPQRRVHLEVGRDADTRAHVRRTGQRAGWAGERLAPEDDPVTAVAAYFQRRIEA